MNSRFPATRNVSKTCSLPKSGLREDRLKDFNRNLAHVLCCRSLRQTYATAQVTRLTKFIKDGKDCKIQFVGA